MAVTIIANAHTSVGLLSDDGKPEVTAVNRPLPSRKSTIEPRGIFVQQGAPDPLLSLSKGRAHFLGANQAPTVLSRTCQVRPPRALCQEPALSEVEGLGFHTARSRCVPPNFFHHIFLVRSSQTCIPIGATISRQRTIENCARLQRRTRFEPRTFHRYLTTYLPGHHPRKCTPNRRFRR